MSKLGNGHVAVSLLVVQNRRRGAGRESVWRSGSVLLIYQDGFVGLLIRLVTREREFVCHPYEIHDSHVILVMYYLFYF